MSECTRICNILKLIRVGNFPWLPDCADILSYENSYDSEKKEGASRFTSVGVKVIICAPAAVVIECGLDSAKIEGFTRAEKQKEAPAGDSFAAAGRGRSGPAARTDILLFPKNGKRKISKLAVFYSSFRSWLGLFPVDF